ncbi:Predicted arabinose efflux permease, MFS family [Granulicella pectinivorans]|uniref:Predicted arabinose efflux permease, MFS family n=1 Tax=Granulicella pectinivorans TaxID=474950 RepID=A0A1I6MTJ3_9BACT|nr:Predicted arabinose efflux permease, MFS family [Granulicella pectinivorans]
MAQPSIPQGSMPLDETKRSSVRALQWTNFFLADVQAGLGPFVAAYLASLGWHAGAVGRALTFGGIVTVLLQTPAGWMVDRVAWKRTILVAGSIVLALGAILLATSASAPVVYTAQGLIGLAGPFLGPTIAAITMGLVGSRLFDCQFGRNQGFNAAGNLFAAAVIAGTSRYLGNRAIFYAVAVLVLPTIGATLAIKRDDIDLELARGGSEKEEDGGEVSSPLAKLAKDRVLLTFLACAFLFHFANAAMLPQLGELLAHGSMQAAAPFMGACVAITQIVMLCTAAYVGRFANHHGRKGLLLFGFAVLPIRAVLYTVFHAVPALLAVQILDGVANSIFGVVSILVIADRTRGTGRFNLAQGALATAVGLGAAMSNSFGGMLMEKAGYRTSFLALGALACLAFLLLLFAIPETVHGNTEPNQFAKG